jgi:hypothetical protein
MLYLGTTVLILFDLSYLSRFWTQFEAWLSMQFATPNGLKSAVGAKYARHHIVCIQNASDQSELYTKALVDTWASKTPQQAFYFLSKPDVTVTNQSDKQGQLPKIKALDATVRGAFQAVMATMQASSAPNPLYQGFHPGISCDRSGMNPIVGMRFHLRGSTYDLCQAEYDKLDDAEKGQYEAIPPPPPGLKLEGGSLTGAAAGYMGVYRLDRSKLVNGRPAYQHVADGSRWLAFDGAIWRGQPEADLGQMSGPLLLTDETAATPDASAATWLAETGSGLAAQPQLKCTPCTPPPPPGLKLEGGSLEGAAAEYMGGYSLFSGKLVNGRPAWRHTAHFTCWLAFDGAIWRGQPEADLGQKRGFLMLPDTAAATPDASASTWLAETGSGLAETPQLKCTPCTPPPPPGLKLEGGSLPGAAAEYMGEYCLDRSKLVNGRPAYQHMAHLTCWLAFDGAIWRGQPEADLGQKRGLLQLSDTAAATPDASAATWLAETGSGLVEQPQLKCIPCTPPPPPGLKLEGGSLPGDAAEYMGGYRLVVGELVNGRPAFQQVTPGSSLADGSRWIAFTGDGWIGQIESSLGEENGFLFLRDPAAASPDVSTKTWKASTKTWKASWAGRYDPWVEAPQLKCTAWTPPPPPPPGLKLEGGSLEGAVAKYMGEYRLAVDDRVWPPQAGEAGRRGGPMLVNGRPAWRHTTHLTCWLAFDGANWRLQPEASLGQERGVLMLPDAAAWSPDASSATWLAANGPGSARAAQPQLKCIPCAAPPLSRVESRVELEELQVKHFRGPCADCCKPLAPCCCVSADGEAIFGCVPMEPSYILFACLHMALCPQLGCDPWGGAVKMDMRRYDLFEHIWFSPFLCLQVQSRLDKAYW